MKGVDHIAKVVGESVRRKSFTYHGKALSEEDTCLMQELLLIQSYLLRDILPSGHAWRSWMGFLSEPNLDVEKLSDTLKWGDSVLKLLPSSWLDNIVDPRYPRDVPTFKQSVRDRSLYMGLITPVLSLWEKFFSTCDTGAAKLLNQWYGFLTHATLRSLDLSSSLIAEYVALERDEVAWDYPSELLSGLHSIMEGWLGEYDGSDVVPSHGPGQVAERPKFGGRFAKYEVIQTDARLSFWMRRTYLSGSYPLPLGQFHPGRLPRCSRLACVPKSMTKNRTISMEPSALQYFQHGVQRRVKEYIDLHPVLSQHIDLSHQSKSQDLSRRGSDDGTYATIDLSSASDRITLAYVKQVFSHTPLYASLICLRSDATALPSGEIVHLAKFAPMGSDLCFITMCLIFACMCEKAVQDVAGHVSGSRDYQVYGDDIVIRTVYVERLLQILEESHHVVNAAKSFWEVGMHHFREACGGEYLDGVEITPIRVSRRMHINPSTGAGLAISSVENVSSWVKLANAFFSAGYVEARSAVLSVLRRRCPVYEKLSYTSEESANAIEYWRSTYTLPSYSVAILTHSWCCTNYRLPSRWSGANGHPGVFRVQFKACIPKNTEESPVRQYLGGVASSEDVRYFEYWLTLPDRPVKVEAGVEILPEPLSGLFPSRLSWREKWVSA